MSRAWSFRLSNATVMPEKNLPCTENFINKHLLRASVMEALEMVSATLEQLGCLLKDLSPQSHRAYAWTQTGGKGQVSSWVSKSRQNDTIRALAQYFAIQPSDPNYVTNLEKIFDVYEKIKTGLTENYEIVIYRPVERKDYQGRNKPASARGYVSTHKPADKAAYKNYLEQKKRMAAMGGGAVHYTGGYCAGKIHLSLAMFIDGGAANTSDSIARTIVHEASHKFAGTKDHLYEHQSFKNVLSKSELDSTLEAFNLKKSEVKKGGIRYQNGKPTSRGNIVPMYGLTEKGDVFESRLLMENADSYAWAARCIWKGY